MTLKGAPAAKRGNRFEKLWTLSELVRVLRGETDSLRIEVPGLDDVEFVVQSGVKKEFHQAKYSHQRGKWNIGALKSAGVLKTIGELLRDEAHRFVFASGSDAPELKNLCEAAVSAKSLDEFTNQFLKAETRAKPHEQVIDIWNCGELDAWKMLRHVEVHTISDNELETKVKWGLTALFVDPDGVQDKLSAIVDDSVHHTIERDELIRDLHEAGYALRRVPGNARHVVVEATDRFLSGARRNLIRGSVIRRDVATEVVDRLTSNSSSDCVLTGQAGMGKTACVVEIVDGLRQARVQVLAFRLDRHMSATTTTDLGRRLNLEESPTLVLGAASKAAGRPAVLIVDQLDAISAMSGRSSEAFDIVDRLISEAKPSNIRTLVVCRSFDWQHDPHLRGLLREESQRVELGKLSPDEVRTVLSQEPFDPDVLEARQLELLRVPQNLSLFLDSGLAKSVAPSFRTKKDLFDAYWDFKRRRVKLRTQGAGDQWKDVIGTVCSDMTQTQRLSVRKEKLDGFSSDYLDQYVSENVLTKDGDTYGFGHESFFDYCFARLFAAGDASLTSVLQSSEQHLFRRAQVRQVLAYLRDSDFQRYMQEMRDLVRAGGIRTHVKELTFTLLAGVDEPTEDEWVLWMDWVRPALDAMEHDGTSSDRLADRAWQLLYRAKSWFKKFDDSGMIKDWLETENAHQADVAIAYLRWQQRNWPERVATLLEPYADQGGDWPDRLRAVMRLSDIHASRPLFDLFLKLVDNGVFDGDDIWERCWQLAHQPGWMPEVLAHQLRRCVTLATGKSKDAIWRDLSLESVDRRTFQTAIEQEPRAFVNHVLPAVLETAQAASNTNEVSPVSDAVWSYLVKSDTSMLGDVGLHALADALAALAGQGEDLRDEIASLSNHRIYVANLLLLALFRGDAARYADEAVLAFCDQPWRFDCGYSDSPYWFATETIRAAVPHCEAANRTKLESTILSYVGPYEDRKEGIRQRGFAAFNLLAAIPHELRSTEAKHRFGELERKFKQPFSEPRGIVGGFVQSPIPSEAAERMDDDQWRRAIVAYPSSEGRSLLEGGAVQLARQFGRCTAAEPERFAKIGLGLPSATNPVYFAELLRGLSDASVADVIKVQVGQRVFEYAKDECGKEIVDILANANAALPDHALQMLISLATEPYDTDEEEAWQQLASSGQPYYGGEIHTNGINTTRGRAAQAIGQLIGKDASYIQRLGNTLDELASEPRPAVASCVAMALRTVAFHDAERGLSLFQHMDFSEERLLATHHVYGFIRENLRRGLTKLEDALLRALRSAHPEVRQTGARLACLAALHHSDALYLAEEARHGDSHQRRGVAEVASANIGDRTHQQWCEEALKSLFSDSDAEVRKGAASCFREIAESRLGPYGDLIEAFCASPAFEEDPLHLIDALGKARSQLPGTVCLVCETFLDSQNHHADGYPVVELIFRLYQHHQDDEWTPRALDLIDRACLELDGATEGFKDYDR